MNEETIALFNAFPGYESTVAAVARHMARHGIAPRDVLDAYDVWLFRRMGDMVPVASETTSEAAPRREAVESRIVRACPKCGGTVYLRKLCPKVSPKWRTQLVCTNAACDWHGLSTLLLPDLLAAGAAGIKQHVQEG